MSSVVTALRGKRFFPFLRRATSIRRGYGITSRRIERALAEYAAVLREFGVGASIAITAVVLGRNLGALASHFGQEVEFVVHGYRHVDYSELPLQEQLVQFRQARDVFEKAGIQSMGFRSPYLRRGEDTLAALQQAGLAYDASKALFWDVVNRHGTEEYEHVLRFYGALPAECYPSVPSLEDDLVCIPYSLPDDEALVERLALRTCAEQSAIWLAILRRSHELGELFALGLHPERATLCLASLRAVLAEARSLTPPVWIARLNEIAAWWRARAEATVQIGDLPDGGFHLVVSGPPGTTILTRGVHSDATSRPWDASYQLVQGCELTVHSPLRPWIGLPPGSPPTRTSFLRQQGYIVEFSREPSNHAYYLARDRFAAEDKRSILSLIEETDRPLVRLGRWPSGAKSGLSVTGDIDALTLWDFALRFLGR